MSITGRSPCAQLPALDAWAHFNKVKPDYSRPGTPVNNPHIESFNGSFRDECLNMKGSRSFVNESSACAQHEEPDHIPIVQAGGKRNAFPVDAGEQKFRDHRTAANDTQRIMQRCAIRQLNPAAFIQF